MKPTATAIPMRKHILTSLIIIAIVFGGSVTAIRSLVRHEQQEDYRHWQTMLDGMADAKANAINAWLGEQFTVLGQLAANPSLKLYSQQLMANNHEAETEQAAMVFLRNLLLATAERQGFIHDKPSAAIQANLTVSADNGLALLDDDLQQLIATPGFSYPTAEAAAKIKAVMASGQPAILDVISLHGRPVLAFLVPFSGLQKTSAAGHEPIGLLMGYKDISASLFPTLKTPATGTDEALLVRPEGESITYLTPLADGSPALGRHTTAGAEQAVAYACAHPGLFAELPDHTGRPVLFTSRAIKATPWILIQKIGADAALAESREHARFLVITLTLASLLAVALLIAAWWYGASARQQAHGAELRVKTAELEAKTRLLDAINANISDLILLVGAEATCLFANGQLARQLHCEASDLTGKSLANIFGAAPARLLSAGMAAALEQRAASTDSFSLDLGGQPHDFHAIFTPISQGPASEQAAVLITMHDMTGILAAQRRESILFQQLIKALMRAIDLHDPYSANHSAKTAALAKAMGQAMNLPATDMTTLEIAANLCNLGKLSIPREILIKQDGLTDEELQQIRQESQYAADLLRDLDFPGPLRTTILQKHEFLDGSGQPCQAKDGEIIRTARVLAVANAFVAMISPRAYRHKMKNAEALALLMADADRKYDRKALAALFQVVENRPDWAD